jgi:hypothetical protein
MRSLILALLRYLLGLFGRRSPMGLDEELGWWSEPDIVLSPSPSARPPPRPLVNNDCGRSHVVYSSALNPVETCDFAAKQQALRDALDQATAYFNDHFQCRNPNCRQKSGQLLWMGTSCDNDPPRSATAAGLVRFSCVMAT